MLKHKDPRRCKLRAVPSGAVVAEITGQRGGVRCDFQGRSLGSQLCCGRNHQPAFIHSGRAPGELSLPCLFPWPNSCEIWDNVRKPNPRQPTSAGLAGAQTLALWGRGRAAPSPPARLGAAGRVSHHHFWFSFSTVGTFPSGRYLSHCPASAICSSSATGSVSVSWAK